ncbi:hypothetical protein [Nocardioides jishulii]|uniref:Arylsulfatase n=1 Tax=Nocardioides jishulii TaxID=2575440 RepID=A0A4U2YMD0_9ACTN|nr:hypothetical protein [Nocardioides jishulii]QCX27580.1 hypothetical protein FCL41_08635 [Nocardioides jishulii]TKI62387.1 hypothetical protein FC770_08300 [Nocardioides jishulii]
MPLRCTWWTSPCSATHDATGSGGQELADRVAGRLAELRAGGADVVVCTCSTIGGLAESVGGAGAWRVDRPAAGRAVASGRRVGVVVALESTVEPTCALLEEEAARAGVRPTVEVLLAEGAWAAWEAGDLAGYLERVARSARLLADRSDVVLLAQASMAGAVALLDDVSVPVISTPASAVEWAVASGPDLAGH